MLFSWLLVAKVVEGEKQAKKQASLVVVASSCFFADGFQVTVDEFIEGCAKLQGEATALETKVLHLEAV